VEKEGDEKEIQYIVLLLVGVAVIAFTLGALWYRNRVYGGLKNTDRGTN
jgi:NADH:ubiquinone oxidoreductase subunit 6 (subunit J)